MDYSNYLHLNSLSYFCYVDLVWKVEQWKDVIEYAGLYQVSDLGRVKSLGNDFKSKDKILKQNLNSVGYLIVTLSKNGKPKSWQIHQLVAIVFLGHKRCGYKLVVNHKDIIKTNNKLSNLEIVTHRKNTSLDHLKSSSQYVGVYWNKSAKKWMAQCKANGKRYYLGLYDDENDANIAYETFVINL